LERPECEAFYALFDLRLPEKDEADEAIINVVQPDIAVICDPSKIDEKGCRGAPRLDYRVSIQKSESLVEIKAREKFYRGHISDIPRIKF
jgi:hypothetical protein